MKNIKKDKLQKKVIKFALSKIKNENFTLSLCTGFGKTRTSLKILEHLRSKISNLKILIVYPTKDIKKGWYNEAKKIKSNVLEDVDFVTYRSLTKIKVKYDLIIFDEVHNITENHSKWLRKMFIHKVRMLGLTGTPPSDIASDKYKIISTYFPVIMEYSIDDGVKDGILNDYEIILHPIKLSAEKNIPIEYKKNGKKHVFYTSELNDYNFNKKQVDENTGGYKFKSILKLINRMKKYKSKYKYILNILDSFNDKTLFFVNFTKDKDLLNIPVYHHSNKQNDRLIENFRNGKITKLGSIEMLAEGVNIPELKNIVILHSYSSDRFVKQKLGRAMRLPLNEKATIHILYYKNTLDEKWLMKAISSFDKNKIKYANS